MEQNMPRCCRTASSITGASVQAYVSLVEILPEASSTSLEVVDFSMEPAMFGLV